VHVGHLGYLTEVEPTDLDAALSRYFAGDYLVERRMTLQVDVEARSGGVAGWSNPVLNEAALEKTAPGRTIRLALTINDVPFMTYVVDGLIVATPTGSTAYTLSARGPILAPGHRATVLTPVAPHMLFDRALVFEPSDEVRLDVLDGLPATLSVDGRDLGELASGDAIVCRAGPHDALLVTFGRRDFHRILKAKFGLSEL
jgi:NAD+ kinase